MSQQTSTRISHVRTVIVSVTDQDRAVDFYTGVLGLELQADVPFGDGMRWIEVGVPGTQTTVALCTTPDGVPAGNAMTGISFNTDDIAAFHAELRTAGADVDAEVSREGDPVPPLFWLRDPDNNTLLVVESQDA